MVFSAIFKLIGGFKGVIVLLLIAALGGYLWDQHHKLIEAQKAVVTAQQERDEAATARDTAIAADKADQATFAQLQQEKADIQTALNNLQVTTAKDKTTIAKLSSKVNSATSKSNPQNQVTLSPVLAGVLTDIQAERLRRAGVTQ